MNHLIFYSSTNTHGKNDSSGAFTPETIRLYDYLRSQDENNRISVVPITTNGKSSSEKRIQVEKALHEYRDIKFDSVFFLCHGYKHGIQFGYSWKWGAKRLVEKLTQHNPSLSAITFYCCSVSKDKGNLAQWTFDELKEKSEAEYTQVFGHYSKGHATMNPNIKIFSSHFQPFMWSQKTYKDFNELVGINKKETSKKMRDPENTLRFSIPFLPMIMKKYGFTWRIK